MALTFKTADLLALIDGIVSAAHAEDERYARECIAARADYKRKWWDDHKSRVRDLRDHLTKCLKNDVPPTETEVRKIMGKQSTVTWFSEGGDGNVTRSRSDYWRVDQIAGMAELLRAHQEPTITAYQLKELGTHPRDLEHLFRTAAAAGAKVTKP